MSIYIGPLDEHPFMQDSMDGFVTINPAITKFNFGAGNGWRHQWTEETIETSVIDRMTYAAYKNQRHVAWHLPNRFDGNKWIRIGSDRVMMDISNWCKKGRYEWTDGLTYLESYAKAMIHVYNNDEDVKGFHIKGMFDIIFNNDKHELGYLGWQEALYAFFLNLTGSHMPCVIEEDGENLPFLISRDRVFLEGHRFDSKWLEMEELSSLVKFQSGRHTLFTRRYKGTILPRWFAWRLTLNPNDVTVRAIMPKTMAKRFAWVHANERKQMDKANEVR